MNRKLIQLFGMILFVSSLMILANGTVNTHAVALAATEATRDLESSCSSTLNHSVHRVGFSPDGKLLLADTSDTELKLWDIQTGKVIHTLTDEIFEPPPVGFRFSPDGKYIVTPGGVKKTAILWEVSTGKQVRILWNGLNYDNSELRRIFTPTFSRDGKYVFGYNYLGLYLWEVETGTLVHKFSSDDPDLGWEDADYSSDGRFVIAHNMGSNDKPASEVWVWDAHTGKRLHVFVAARAGLFSPDSKYILTWGVESVLWDINTYSKIDVVEVDGTYFFPGGKYLLGYNGQESISLYSIQTGRRVVTLSGAYENYDILVMDENHLLLPYKSEGEGDTYPASTTYRVWDIAAAKEVRKLVIGGYIYAHVALDISPDKKSIATGSQHGAVRLWDAATGKELGVFC